MQENALNLVNVRSQQEIEKYPDVSTAGALSRIPSVSLETDTGEGRFVNIRGLDSDLNGTTFGGVKLPASSPASPFGGGRSGFFSGRIAGDTLHVAFIDYTGTAIYQADLSVHA